MEERPLVFGAETKNLSRTLFCARSWGVWEEYNFQADEGVPLFAPLLSEALCVASWMWARISPGAPPALPAHIASIAKYLARHHVFVIVVSTDPLQQEGL